MALSGTQDRITEQSVAGNRLLLRIPMDIGLLESLPITGAGVRGGDRGSQPEYLIGDSVGQ
jgi:hypothetical protein